MKKAVQNNQIHLLKAQHRYIFFHFVVLAFYYETNVVHMEASNQYTLDLLHRILYYPYSSYKTSEGKLNFPSLLNVAFRAAKRSLLTFLYRVKRNSLNKSLILG
jgi:hypothetical protein